MYQLYSVCKRQDEDVPLKYLKLSADNGFGKSQYILGKNSYQNNRWISAKKYLELAQNNNYPFARNLLTEMKNNPDYLSYIQIKEQSNNAYKKMRELKERESKFLKVKEEKETLIEHLKLYPGSDFKEAEEEFYQLSSQ